MRPLVGGALLSVVGKAFGTGSSSTGVCSLPAFLQRLAWRPSPFSDRTRSFDRIFISPPALRRLFYRVRAIRVPMLPLHSWRGRSRTLRRDAPPCASEEILSGYPALGSMAILRGGAAFGMISSNMPSFNVAVTFPASTGEGRSITRII